MFAQTVFEARQASFIGSHLLSDAEKFELIDEYQVLTTNVQIFKHPEKIELIYNINPRIYFVTRPLFLFCQNKRHITNYQPGKVTLARATGKCFQRICKARLLMLLKIPIL